MLSPFARALTYYLAGGFALTLFCAIWYLDQPALLDERWQQRIRRRMSVLTPLGLAHPVVALAAVGLALDLARAEGSRAGVAVPAAFTSLVVSLTGMTVVLAVTS